MKVFLSQMEFNCCLRAFSEFSEALESSMDGSDTFTLQYLVARFYQFNFQKIL